MANGARPWDAASSEGSAIGSPADASSCHAGSVGTFVPNSYRPAASIAGACDVAQIGAYFDACFGPAASAAACNAFAAMGPANAACVACIRTPDNAARYGPLVGSGSLVRSNVAGCIELTASALHSCAKAVQAVSGCELAACGANCPVVDNESSSRLAYNACAVAADDDGCSAYVTAAQCAAAGVEGGADSGCLTTAFADFYNFAVPVFCGPNATTDGSVGAAPADAAASEDGAAPADATLSEDAASLDASLTDAARSDAAASQTGGDASEGGAPRPASDASIVVGASGDGPADDGDRDADALSGAGPG